MQTEHPNSDLLGAFVSGSLPDENRQSVESHLANCDTCCESLDRLTANDGLEVQLGSLCEGDLAPEATMSWVEDFKREKPYADELLRRGQLGNYDITGLLGKGGMGAVYKAKHRVLMREAALKTMSYRTAGNDDAVERFRREAQLLARLNHANIVGAYDADVIDDIPFLAMEYVPGTDLHRRLKEDGPLPIAEACVFIRQAALALEHAQTHGIVHRDIKPANMLLMQDRSAIKLSDLGLGRLEEIGRDEVTITHLTQAPTVMGTPDFMAPEQWHGADVDVRADLYSLGCTFYCLITGQAPYPKGTADTKRVRHKEGNPKPIQQLRPEVPAAVAAIVRKLMAVKPGDRYQTPRELIEALDKLETQRRSRLPAPLYIAAGIAATFLVAATILFFQFNPFQTMFSNGAIPQGQSKDKPNQPQPNDKIAKSTKPKKPPSLPLPAKFEPLLVKELVAHTDPVTCVALSPDGSTFSSGSKDGTVIVWDGKTLAVKATLPHSAAVTALAYSPDGRKLATCCQKGFVRLWDISTKKETKLGQQRLIWNDPMSIAFSPDGKVIAAGSYDGDILMIWDPAGKEKPQVLKSNIGIAPGDKYGQVVAVAFTPDSKFLASSHRSTKDPKIRFWDLAKKNKKKNGELQQSIPQTSYYALAFSPDGESLAAGNYGYVRMYDMKNNRALESKPLKYDEKHTGGVSDLAYSADGRVLAAAVGSGRVVLWNVSTRKKLADFTADVATGNKGFHLAMSKDAKRLVTGGLDKKVKVWSLDGGTKVQPAQKKIAAKQTLKGHTGNLSCVAFGPLGKSFATGSGDKSVRIWDAGQLKQLHILRHENAVAALAYSPDGKHIATCDAKGIVRLWSIDKELAVVLGTHKGFLPEGLSIAFSPNGQHIASGCFRTDPLKVWDPLRKIQSISLQHEAPGQVQKVAALAYSPDSRILASGLDGPRTHGVQLWDAKTNKKLDFLATGHPARALAFSQTGDKLAISLLGGVHLWKVDSKKRTVAPGIRLIDSQKDDTATGLTFIPKSQIVAAAFRTGNIVFWNYVTGKRVARFKAHAIALDCDLAISPDGSRLVTVGEDADVHVWSIQQFAIVVE